MFKQANLTEFVETGLTMVSVRSASFGTGSAALSRIPSGQTIRGDLVIVNPKSFDVSYTLAPADSSFFTQIPSSEPSPSDATHLAFSFALEPSLAEHKTITFSLGKYVASINKTYDNETISIICDSLPNPAARVATVMDSGEKSLLAVLLPTEISDDDLAQLKITWSQEGQAASTATYGISSLAAAPASNPFSSTYDCYFQSSDCVAGYGYSYSVVVIDAAGQESTAVSTSSTANVFYLNYKGNGNTSGTAPASAGYRFGATATVASIGDLAKTDYAFYRWNTAADGSGTSYSPGATLTIPAGETTLYAIWVTNAVTISFDIGTQGLAFSSSSTSVPLNSPLAVSCSNALLAASGTDWKWYVDGILDGSQTGPSFTRTWTSAGNIGQYIISCSVTYKGLSYSGSFRAMVTQ
jgi:hypothetical protein